MGPWMTAREKICFNLLVKALQLEISKYLVWSHPFVTAETILLGLRVPFKAYRPFFNVSQRI